MILIKVGYCTVSEVVCVNCNKTFKNLSGLNSHKNHCKGIQLQAEDIQIDAPCLCPVCGKHFSKSSSMKKHLKAHNNRSSICSFCGKSYSDNGNLLKHVKYHCEFNPNRIDLIPQPSLSNNRGGWNRGKTKDTDASIAKQCETYKQHFEEGLFSGSFLGKQHTEQSKNKIRLFAINNATEKRFRNRKTFIYKNQKFVSRYEVRVAEELDKNNIQWTAQPCRFPYVAPDGKQHHYTPDFYLPEYDVYLDPKNDYLINSVNQNFGYSDMDKISWVCEQNRIRVLILSDKELTWNVIKSKIGEWCNG